MSDIEYSVIRSDVIKSFDCISKLMFGLRACVTYLPSYSIFENKTKQLNICVEIPPSTQNDVLIELIQKPGIEFHSHEYQRLQCISCLQEQLANILSCFWCLLEV